MRSAFGQTQEHAMVRAPAEAIPPPAVAITTKEIPYDYVAKFTLKGRRGQRTQDVINISIEGAFVAQAIGYSFIPKGPDALPPTIPGAPADPPSGPLSAARLSAATMTFPATLLDIIADPFAARLSEATGADQVEVRKQLAAISGDLLRCLQLRLCGIDFKYSMMDSGTGRELQNQPIHNVAGLGESNGNRPFRPLARPMLFVPRSTIRIEVEEVSEGLLYEGAELFIVLHGYKVLGYGTTMP
jgi:hypothetical protein